MKTTSTSLGYGMSEEIKLSYKGHLSSKKKITVINCQLSVIIITYSLKSTLVTFFYKASENDIKNSSINKCLESNKV